MTVQSSGPLASPVLVTGGTGTLGRQLVGRLRAAGRKVRVLSRHAPRARRSSTDTDAGTEFVAGDLDTGDGVEAALAGTEIIVHCAGSSKGDEKRAEQLVRAASQAGTQHLVFISVVGADKVPVAGPVDRMLFGYFASKLSAERVMVESGLPWTTLRATQFHDLVFMVAQQMARLPVMPVPTGFRFQPVDTGEVADRLVELALGPPAGLVPPIAGPQVYEMGDLLRSYLRASHRHRLIVPLWLPGRAARAVRAGAILAPERASGRVTWEDFLTARIGPPGEKRSRAVWRTARSDAR
jgi:uncharacterized protein YbjT (DUF2867 family)